MAANTLGHWVNGKEVFEGAVIERRNPADSREVVATSHDGTTEVVERAVSAAKSAFDAWSRKTTRASRGEIVRRAAEIMNEPHMQVALSDAMVGEIGKTRSGADGEVVKTIKILRYIAGLATHHHDRVFHADQPGVDMSEQTEPLEGVAALVTPFNFPNAVPNWKIAPAVVAGMPIVWKPAPAAPRTSALIIDMWRRAGLPDGVLNMVRGGGDVVQKLVEDPRVQAVSFTGSTPVGTSIYRWAVNREPRPINPSHIVCEMGGQNGVIVMRDADLDKAADAVIASGFFGEGQRCTATSRVIAEDSIYGDLMEKIIERMNRIKIGPGMDATSQVGPLVSEDAVQNALNAVRQSVLNGMVLLAGGNRLTDDDLVYGNFMQPTLMEGDPENPGHLPLREEIFAPVVGAARVNDLDQALYVLNDTVTHQHAASIFTRDGFAAARFMREARVGMRHVNNPTMGGDAQAPFGGLGGDTSYGAREMGPDATTPFEVRATLDANWGMEVLKTGAR